MFDIGIQEILVIMVLALLVFGPEQLPELGRRLGRAMREFRRASDEFRRTVETNLNLDLDGQTPLPPSASDSSSGFHQEGSTSAAVSSEFGSTSAESPTAIAVADGTLAVDGVHANGDAAGAVAESIEPFWTTRGGRLLHRAACNWRGRVSGPDRVPLKTAAEGWDQGLQPCPSCDPPRVEVAS
jgi:TatA/E family protein of Tat protein translocase